MKTSDRLISLGNLTTHVSARSCSVEFPGYFPPKSVALTIVICVVNILSSFSAATANFLVMWAIKKTPSLHTPSSVLLFSLALSDFATGVFVQPLFVVHSISSLTANFSVYCISGAIVYPVGVCLAFVSLSAITAISFDRYLALALHLRYAAIVTVSRVIKLVLLAIIFLSPVSIYAWFSQENWFQMAALCLFVILGAVAIITIPFSYYRIFKILRRHQKQIRNQNSVASRMQGILQVDVSKYKRSVFTILYVLGAILLSYLPGGISFVINLFLKTEVSEFTLSVGGMMVMLNSSINPLVYCWRIKEIRRFVISKLRQSVGVSGLPNREVRVNQVRPVRMPSYHETPI
ncbi:adenosine receptor A3-like [Oculina patagonica]